MRKAIPTRWLFLGALALILVIAALSSTARFTQVVRGKSSAAPLTDELTPDQALAQDLALSDPQVQRFTLGYRTEVFGVRDILADQYTADSRACATADCRQVEIYDFDNDAAITVIVNLDTKQVLDVLYLPHMRPGINKRLADLAIDIAINSPEVIETLGFRPQAVDMAPVDSHAIGSSCDEGHLCAGPTFELGDRVLWAIVDLTEEKLASLEWTFIDLDTPAPEPFISDGGCPAGGSVNRDGWSLDYQVTGTDGLRVYNATYNGTPVLTSLKLVEWHADYGTNGFEDYTGCGGGGGGFPISPYGPTHVYDLITTTPDSSSEFVNGFEVVQDFRMSSWGSGCNYRYEQRLRFYNDGSFRVVSGAYGKGCGTNALYRPVVRIDIAVDGDSNDNFARWDGSQWAAVTTEDYYVPYSETGHGPHHIDGNGYSWRITDSSGAGYYVVQDVGQFDGDSGHGATPFLFPTLHHAAEGDTDLGIIGDCCYDDERQGPHNFLNGESIQNANIVLWYVPQSDTDATGPDYYCWTVSGEPNPETYPCFAGPLFVPINTAAKTQPANS